VRVIVDHDNAQAQSRISLRDKAAQAAVNIGGLIARRDDDRDLSSACDRRRLDWLEILQKAMLLESPGDQPDHGRKPDRRQQKVQGSTGRAAIELRCLNPRQFLRVPQQLYVCDSLGEQTVLPGEDVNWRT
jgi:hypothetical protein